MILYVQDDLVSMRGGEFYYVRDENRYVKAVYDPSFYNTFTC